MPGPPLINPSLTLLTTRQRVDNRLKRQRDADQGFIDDITSIPSAIDRALNRASSAVGGFAVEQHRAANRSFVPRQEEVSQVDFRGNFTDRLLSLLDPAQLGSGVVGTTGGSPFDLRSAGQAIGESVGVLSPEEEGVPADTRIGITTKEESPKQGPRTKAAINAEIVAEYERALQDGTTPSLEVTTDAVVESTIAKAGRPVSEAEKAQIKTEAKGFVERLRSQDRVDLLAAGLGILSASADRSKPAGAVIADGLLAGISSATAQREAKFRNQVILAKLINDTKRADAAVGSSQAALIRANAAMASAGQSKITTETAEKFAKSFLEFVVADGDEQTVEALSPIATQAIKEMKAKRIPITGEALLKQVLAQGAALGMDVSIDDGFLGFGDPSIEVNRGVSESDNPFANSLRALIDRLNQ